MQLCYTGKFKLIFLAALMTGIVAIMVFGAGKALAWDWYDDDDDVWISGLSPANGSTISTSNTTITATFEFADGDDVWGWSMTLDGVALSSCSQTWEGMYIHVSCPVTNLGDGSHQYTAAFWGYYYYDDMEWYNAKTVSFNVSASADTTPPVTTDNAPAGWQKNNVTVNLSCSDSASGCAYTTYEVNGGATQTGNSVTLSSDGTHAITYRSTDNAGNTESTKTATVQIDKTAPSVSNIQPTGTIGSSSTSVSASFSDATSGIDTGSASLAVYGGTVSDCVTTAAGISCNVSGLAEGSHAVTVSVSDNAGNAGTSSSSFAVSLCQPAKPAVELAGFRPYWASYANYTAGLLSLEYVLGNAGPGTAFGVAFVGATNTNDVTVASSSPVGFGDISAGSSAFSTVTYNVPAGVGSFKTSVYATAQDACGITYNYPGPMPGA